jgi:short-subunit dehydrogenase
MLPMNPATVVTGAASGIGRELAHCATLGGAVVVLVDRSQEGLADVAVELGKTGVQAHAVLLDLVSQNAGQRLESALSELGLYCDVLINCAGFGVFGVAAQTDRRLQLELVDVNVRALTELTLRFVPGMIERGRGRILNVGSITGHVPGPNMAAYHASKAYVRSFTAALGAELAGTGVSVTCLAPGIVVSPFFLHTGFNKTRLAKLMPRSTAREVAKAGWGALQNGKREVMPGLWNQLIIAACELVPHALLLRLIAALQRPDR